VWTIFPHVSVAGFAAATGGTVYMVSILYPGDEPGSSTTTQLFLHTETLDDGVREAAEGQMRFNHHVVENEDYATGLRLQRALRSGGKRVTLFGRNEGGGQRFHAFLGELLEVEDTDLATFFEKAAATSAEQAV
jgi:catechol 2,3-dioxygenase-like lactoylglutathione lyase family enzyme